MRESEILWTPKAENGRLFLEYLAWLNNRKGSNFRDYDEVWQWSTEQEEEFWLSLFEYFEVVHEGKLNQVLSGEAMPYFSWFDGISVNYVENIFRHAHDGPALMFGSEQTSWTSLDWKDLQAKVAAASLWLKEAGIQPGDRVAAYLPNGPEAIIAFFATHAIGAVWSSCSPDFGAQSVIDRFSQIEPKVLFCVSGYQYGGKWYDRTSELLEISQALTEVEKVVLVNEIESAHLADITFAQILKTQGQLSFVRRAFSDPIWILFSSGTTGQPKAITHSCGGVLLEHLKYITLQNDVHKGERYFWYTTTGWMMWNFLQATMLVGAIPVLYDGSPTYPDHGHLWNMIDQLGVAHFGTSPPFLRSCQVNGLAPKTTYQLTRLRTLSSTGSPLAPELFDYVYSQIKSDVWLCSMSGGTDVCTAFIGSVPGKPVCRGKIQGRALGVALHAYDSGGRPVLDAVGEMVITKPMPSMPIYFWGDKNTSRYLNSYFSEYPGTWRHGDWVKIDHKGMIEIMGRSDATLNRHGIRIGTAEIYRALFSVREIEDSLVVYLEGNSEKDMMPLFLKLAAGVSLDTELLTRIKSTIKKQCSPRHVPDICLEVEEIPYTISGKKMERPVKRILQGIPKEQAANLGAMRNPDSLLFFEKLYSSDFQA